MQTLIIVNWKLYLSQAASVNLARALMRLVVKLPDTVGVVICPSLTSLSEVSKMLANDSERRFRLGAQNCFWVERGHFTGEVSPEDLQSIGCSYVIIGHSERRAHLAETGEMINKKLKAALKRRLTPILCVGETLDEKNQGSGEARIIAQLKAALAGVSLFQGAQLVVAYEPVWAIYPSPLEVEPESAEQMASLIKHQLVDLYGQDRFNAACSVIYGGSVDSKNVREFLDLPTVSGVLSGHASTQLDNFAKLLEIVASLKH